MTKKILIIGNGAKEYALAKKLSENNEIYITPASDTLKEFTTCLDIREDSVHEILEYVMENGIDMTIAVSDKAVNSDIASLFNQHKQPIFAPSAKANEIVTNKAAAKKVLYKLRIPTPKFGIFEKLNLTLDYIKNQKYPFVIKTNDNNSATIVTSDKTAKNILESIFLEKNKKAVIEDYIYGTPFSFYTLTDGYKAIPIGSSLSYKHSLEGNGGQLTNGMGACVPNYKLSEENEYFLMNNVILPTLDYLEISGNPYLGILGVNGILTEEGQLMILGWQSFTQDFDSDAIFGSINDNLYDLFESCIIGSFSDEVESISINQNQSVSLVFTCKNKDNNANIINGLDYLEDDTHISFYPSVTKNKYLEFEAANGPVLVMTSSASSLSRARDKVYTDANDIAFSGISYRKDICKVN